MGLVLVGASGCWSFHTAATQPEGSDAALADSATGTADAGDEPEAVGGDAAAGSWCTRQPANAFCCDFDEHPLNVDWDDVYSCNLSSTWTLDTHASTSHPACAFLMISSGGNCGTLTKKLGASTHATCSFDLRVDQAGFSGYPTVIARFDVASSSGVYHADLVGSPGEAKAVIVHGSANATTALAQGLGQLVWARVTMDFDIGAPSTTLSVRVGTFGPATVTLGSPTGVTGVSLQLGTPGDEPAPPNGTWQLRYDDVLCTVVP